MLPLVEMLVFALTALEVKFLVSYDEMKGSQIQCCLFFGFFCNNIWTTKKEKYKVNMQQNIACLQNNTSQVYLCFLNCITNWKK